MQFVCKWRHQMMRAARNNSAIFLRPENSFFIIQFQKLFFGREKYSINGAIENWMNKFNFLALSLKHEVKFIISQLLSLEGGGRKEKTFSFRKCLQVEEWQRCKKSYRAEWRLSITFQYFLFQRLSFYRSILTSQPITARCIKTQFCLSLKPIEFHTWVNQLTCMPSLSLDTAIEGFSFADHMTVLTSIGIIGL